MAKTTPVANADMLNAIRDEASPAYQAAVPEATPLNLIEVGNPIMNYEAVGNEFINALVNKIIFQLIERKMWKSPLAGLRGEQMPLGTDIEDIHTNPAKAQPYDGTEKGMSELLKMFEPDVATTYYRLNRQDKYPVTINNEQLRGAFTSWGKLNTLIDQIVDSLYNGATIDEFNYTKNLVSDAVTNGKVVTQNIIAPVDRATGMQFLKTLRNTSVLFTFPSTKYNSYQLNGGTKTPRTNWCPIEDQVLLLTADVATEVGVDVLADIFHLDFASYLTSPIIVDEFGNTDVLGVLADRRAFIIMEQLRHFRTFNNGSSLSWQYFYHVWDLFALSPFRNMVAFKKQ